MTTVLEKLFYFLAPHDCILCGNEGNIVCAACRAELSDDRTCACHVCGLPAADYRPCGSCRSKTSLNALFALGAHEAELREVIHHLKFNGARQAAIDLAPALAELLPVLPEALIVTHLPTADMRARARGFDQAQLLANSLAADIKRPSASLLRRHGKTRQVGASQTTRRKQAETMFSVLRADKVKNKPILLVDDVVTTSASMEAAAKLLKQAGAAEVYGVAAARKI